VPILLDAHEEPISLATIDIIITSLLAPEIKCSLSNWCSTNGIDVRMLQPVQITFDRAPIHLDGIAFEAIVFVSFSDVATRIGAPDSDEAQCLVDLSRSA